VLVVFVCTGLPPCRVRKSKHANGERVILTSRLISCAEGWRYGCMCVVNVLRVCVRVRIVFSRVRANSLLLARALLLQFALDLNRWASQSLAVLRSARTERRG
jgi:hypothetical protein